MSTENGMDIDGRRTYLNVMKPRYVKSNRKGKGRLLDEMETVTGLNRKVLVRLLGSDLRRKPRRRERGRTYGPRVAASLGAISTALDDICAERLTPNLVWMAAQLGLHRELAVNDSLLEQLGQISVSTVTRRLSEIVLDKPRKLRQRRHPNQTLLQTIPAGRLAWDIQVPGHFEVDLVHHGGASTSGHYMHTLQCIDVATGWSERRAVLGRSQLVIEDAFRCLLGRLPFPVQGLHPDNDEAFMNCHLLRFWGQLVPTVAISRSRPYHKNDNPRVEQKNSTLVRAYFADERFDTVAHVLLSNRIYDMLWVYNNLFQPVMHVREKEVIPAQDGKPARVRRRYDVARTPFDRLCATDAILPEHRATLEALRQATNPSQLRIRIYQALDVLYDLPGATPERTEDVYQTLSHSSAFDNVVGDPLHFAFHRTTAPGISYSPSPAKPVRPGHALHLPPVPGHALGVTEP